MIYHFIVIYNVCESVAATGPSNIVANIKPV